MNDPRGHLSNAVATVLTHGSATDTSSDAMSIEAIDSTDDFGATETRFEREPEISGPALLELAQRAVTERDALRGEVVRLREALARSEANQRRGQSSSRELAELREAVDLREREVRRLKDANVARERLLVDARTRLDEALHARAAAVSRMETRERAALDAEARLERAARDAEAKLETALADAASWKSKFEAIGSELHRALASERALTGSFEDARLRLSDAERTIATLRAELADTRQALSDLGDNATRAEEANRDRVERLEREHARYLARVAEREDALSEGRERGLRFAAAESLHDARAQWQQERAQLIEEIKNAIADSERVREEHQLDLVAWKQRNTLEREHGEAALDGCARGYRFKIAEVTRELEVERASRMCEATRQGQALNALRESHEFAIAAIRARLAREQERAKRLEDEADESASVRDAAAVIVAEHVRGLEAELEAERAFNEQCLADTRTIESVRDEAAVAIAAVIAGLEAKIERLEQERGQIRRALDECDATRETLAQATVESAQRAVEARSKHEALEREYEQHTRQMAELVGILTRATVEQHAIAGALKHGRVLPTMADVDAALVSVGRRVPPTMAEQLWTARDAIAAAIFAGPIAG
ncbi:MAG: hypothetical protein JNK05_01165 [Myxococcales bacterium]|nr:hypothetical protein [Myxococcales bacterium]